MKSRITSEDVKSAPLNQWVHVSVGIANPQERKITIRNRNGKIISQEKRIML